jgi:radical SAM superfamily enzyme YgiQ (UPF0313 family)
MKYLLIVHDVYQDYNVFPLGIAYLASVLRNDGHDVEVMCMDIFHHTTQQLINHLEKNTYDVIGFGFMAARYKETALPLCKIINKYKKNAKLILGGHCPSSIPEYILSKTEVDGIVVGEGESVISNIYDLTENKNIIYSEPIKKLDKIPFPAWDMFPMDKYVMSMKYPGQRTDQKSLTMITTRGCTNRCSFCYRMNKGIRLRSIDNIVQEIKHLNNNYGVTYFEFGDECFLMHKKRLEEFGCKLKDNNLDINFWCAVRVDLVDEEILYMLKEIGCSFINYGFESMNPLVLNEVNKNVSPEDNENAAMITKDTGIPFGVNFIWGCPSDDKITLKEDVNFIQRYNSPLQCRTIRPVTPYPGCQLYYDALEMGLLKGPDDFFNIFQNSDRITVNFTMMPTTVMYEELYKANAVLVEDYRIKSGINPTNAYNMVKNFYNLYFNGNVNFRGVRHYDRKQFS